MKQMLKKNIQDKFITIIDDKNIDLDPHVKHTLTNDLADIAYEIILKNNESISKSYNDAVLELDQHKKQFRDHIELIDKNCKIMLNNFKTNGFVRIESGKNGGKHKLVGRTTMVDEMVNFLNILNDSVTEFYERVYKIEKGETLMSSDIKQTTLF